VEQRSNVVKQKRLTNQKIEALVEQVAATYQGDHGINFIDASSLPVRGKILETLDLLIEVLFPGHTGRRTVTQSNIQYIVGDLLCQIYTELADQIERAYRYDCQIKACVGCDCRTKAENATYDLLMKLPVIRQWLKADVEAAYSGDPAAKSHEEIVISYPCITAIATYRVAHELYLKDVPLIPRIMTECAHAHTGIDIHPGARIGRSFFIDHGTGVVIGETSIIGDRVRIYQGVTLGALSFARDSQGRIIKGGKRHPTIEDDVTIYAEATILGDVVIGRGSVIGGNAWIKESVPAGVTVTLSNPELVYTDRRRKRPSPGATRAGPRARGRSGD
jgi:serine O-acetyltransferase